MTDTFERTTSWRGFAMAAVGKTFTYETRGLSVRVTVTRVDLDGDWCVVSMKAVPSGRFLMAEGPLAHILACRAGNLWGVRCEQPGGAWFLTEVSP